MIKNNEELKELVDSLPRNIVELSITVDKAGTYKIPVDSDIIEALTYAVNEIDKLKAEKQKLVDMVESLIDNIEYERPVRLKEDIEEAKQLLKEIGDE